MKMNTDNKIALLIDGDNAQPRFISSVLTEAERLGVVIVKRIYGDWTTDQLLSWKHKLMQHSIKPVQKFAVGKGKNSTDTAIIIDAMDLLHSKKVNGFCIMSSDSDYTGLAQRIREEGMFVMGVGESRKTNTVFVKSCDKFIFIDNLPVYKSTVVAVKPALLPEEPPPVNHTITPETAVETAVSTLLRMKAPVLPGLKILGKIDLDDPKPGRKLVDMKLISMAFALAADTTGMADIGAVSRALLKTDPTFDPRTYGYPSLTALFRGLPDFFELVYKYTDSVLYIKMKEAG